MRRLIQTLYYSCGLLSRSSIGISHPPFTLSALRSHGMPATHLASGPQTHTFNPLTSYCTGPLQFLPQSWPPYFDSLWGLLGLTFPHFHVLTCPRSPIALILRRPDLSFPLLPSSCLTNNRYLAAPTTTRPFLPATLSTFCSLTSLCLPFPLPNTSCCPSVHPLAAPNHVV